MTTGQEMQVQFPFVTKEFTVISSGSTGTGPVLRVHFNSDNGTVTPVMLNHHYVTLDAARESVTFDVKCKEVFITCQANGGSDNGFEVIASLTSILTGNMYPLTGSGLTT